MMPALADTAVPAGFDLAPVRTKLRHSGLRTSSGYRRDITRNSPLMFALVYLDHHLRGHDGQVSLCALHLDTAARMRRDWTRSNLGPSECREAVIAPRESGKTTWPWLVGALWAMAHEHPAGRHIAGFSGSGGQARQHLQSVRVELATNARLQADYPMLCRSVQNRVECYEAASGAAMTAHGMDAETFGAKIGAERPSALLFDDVEPDEKHYGKTTKADRLSQIVNKVLPMAVRAPVCWTATTTAYDSLAHDLVRFGTGQRRPQWIVDAGFDVHYYPAIVVGPDGAEASLWPQQWSLEWLQGHRKTRDYAMNYANMPISNSSVFWSADDITLDPSARGVRRVLMVDPAVTHGPNSDDTGLAVVGVESGGQCRAVVDVAMGKQATFDQLRTAVKTLLHREQAHSPIRKVAVEKNQGGEVWRAALEPVVALFPGVELELFSTSESKEARFARAHDWYQRGWICHSRELPALTDQLLAYPGKHDDIADAVIAGCEVFLRDRSPH